MTDQPTDEAEVARRAIPLLDLTDLSETCAADDVARLCRTALAAGVAAVCVWPRFVAQARAAIEESPVRVATVVNFPAGEEDAGRAVAETEGALAAGAHEIDLVLPYRAVLRGEFGRAEAMVRAVRDACPPGRVRLKVILETGALGRAETVAEAGRLALAAGADFIKTSTGKIPVSATPEAARAMLGAIRSHGGGGLKVSGGLRRVADAAAYLALADSAMGPDWAAPATLRLGASGLYADLARVLDESRENRA